MTSIDSMVKVMQAHQEGKIIEFRVRNYDRGVWLPCFPTWNWDNYDYRVRPEPIEFRVWRVPGATKWVQVNEGQIVHPDYEVITVRQVME